MLRLFDSVFDEKYSLKDKITYLECSSYLGSFIGEGPRSVESVTKKIKSLISIPSSRTEGLILLQAFFPQCSTEVLSENATCWLQFASKTIQDSDKAEDKKLACVTLIKLVPYTLLFPDLNKYTSTLIIPPLVETLLRTSPEHEWIDEALELLELCMLHFPGLCGQFKTNIEKFCISYIHQWYGNRLQRVTSCVASLPFCGGGGSQGINHPTAWTEQMTNILNSMNQLLEMLYNGSEIDDDSPSLFLSSMELPNPPTSDSLLSIFHTSKVYEFVNLCLAQMLSKQTTFSVKIPIEAIITHICKVFATNSNTMVVKPSIDASAIASLIPGMHLSCLKIMETLIHSCRKLLLPQANVINDLLLQTLNWTVADETISGCERPFSILRRATYGVIQLWLEVSGSGTGLQTLAEQFFHQMVLDFKPEIEVHNLQQKSKFEQKKNHQKKHKFKAFGLDQMMSDTNLRKTDSMANKDTVKASLNTLKAMLYFCGPQIQADVWKKIHGTIISLILQIQHQPHKYPIPYSNSLCREALYKVLLAAILGSSSSCSPPLAPAISLFAIGQNDESLEIAVTCFEALVVCNAIAHPKVSVLQYSAPISRANSHLNLGYTEESNAMEEVESEFSEDQDSPMEDDDSQMQQLQAARASKQVTMRNPSLCIEENRQFSHHKGIKKLGKQAHLIKSSEEVIVSSEESDSEDEREPPTAKTFVKPILQERNNQRISTNNTLNPQKLEQPVMAYKQIPTNTISSSGQTSLRQNCNVENRMQPPPSRLELKEERQAILLQNQKPKIIQNKIQQIEDEDSEDEDDEEEEEEDYEEIEDEETFVHRENEEELEEGEMEEDYVEEQEIEEDIEEEEYQEEQGEYQEELDVYPVSTITDPIQCVTSESANDSYAHTLIYETEDLLNEKKGKELIKDVNLDEATEETSSILMSVKETTQIQIVHSESLAPVMSNNEILPTWHSDENGIANDDLNKSYSDQSSDQAMKIISELSQVAESDSHPISHVIVPRKFSHLNDLESDYNPNNEALSKETGVTLQHTLDQVEKINDVHSLNEKERNVEEKYSKENNSILESFCQPALKKICVGAQDDLSPPMPSVTIMQASFVDCGQNE